MSIKRVNSDGIKLRRSALQLYAAGYAKCYSFILSILKHPRLCLLGNCSRRYSTFYVPIVVIRSRSPFQTRLSRTCSRRSLPPPSLESYRLHPVIVPPASMQSC